VLVIDDSTPDEPRAKTRKTYTAEFKLQAVRMVTDQHLAVAEVARAMASPRAASTTGSTHSACGERTPFPGHGRLARTTMSRPASPPKSNGSRPNATTKKAAADSARHSTTRSRS